MNGSWGNKLGLNVFGESHGKAIGVVINNVPAGIKLDYEFIRGEMYRRQSGITVGSTDRKEMDQFEIYSGVFNSHTTGMPLMALITNSDVRHKDYEKIKNILRPSHADWSAYQKYKGFYDYRGGGRFSGRLTAAIVFAGAIAKQILSMKNIKIYSEVLSIGHIYREEEHLLLSRFNSKFMDETDLTIRYQYAKLLTENMINEIVRVKKIGDSIGGKVKIMATGVQGGLGGTLFENVEGRISQMIFSIPAIKGIEFGMGFDMVGKFGSECNDELEVRDGKIIATTNHNGGILGGITNGMAIDFNVIIKPTSSISLKQKSVDISAMKNVEFTIDGRHDSCIVPRIVPVLECATALVLLDLLLDEGELDIKW